MPNSNPPAITFKEAPEKAVLVPLGYTAFVQVSQSGDIDSLNFDIIENAELDFDYKNQFNDLLTDNTDYIKVPNDYRDVEFVLNETDELLFKALKTDQTGNSIRISVAFAFSHPYHGGIDESDDPSCLFLKGRAASCNSSDLVIDSSKEIISGHIVADLFLYKITENTVYVTVTTYPILSPPPSVICAKRIKGTFASSARGNYKVDSTIKFEHTKTRDICYLVKIEWHSKGKLVSEGEVSGGYTNFSQFSIGKRSCLPEEIRTKTSSYILWKQ